MNFDNDFSATSGDAREKVQQVISSARNRTGDALALGEECVRKRPATALLTAFGIGVAVGVLAAAALLRPEPRRKPTLSDSLGDTRERLAELFGTAATNLRDPLRKTYASVSDRASDLGDTVAAALEKVRSGKNLRWW